jgi:hypothetical protein
LQADFKLGEKRARRATYRGLKGGLVTNSRISRALFALALAAALVLAACSDRTGPPKVPSSTAHDAQIAGLSARADRVQDANDIKRLQRAYGFYVDKGEWDQVADLFALDGSVEYANEGVYVGQARIREYLKRLGGGNDGLVEGHLNNHMILQPVVHVAPDGMTAKGRWRALIQAGHYKKDALWGEGTYENEYVKEGGVWKIKKLHWYAGFLAPYEGGWAKMKPVDAIVGDVVKDLPPDMPPTVDYKPYPAAFVPPYHYENPVTGHPAVSAPAAAPTDATLAPWDLEVARLEAHDTIENLQAIYGYYFDKNQWDQVADLFTDDATYEVEQRGVYKGKKRIRQALDLIGAAGAQQGLLNDEFQLQPIIHVSKDGKSAKARWRTLEMKGQHGKSGQWGAGVYENEYALQDGKWKISKLHYYLTFRADYEKGWTNGVVPIAKASKTLPPDAPPTEVYGSLPDVYVPPYHYANLGSHPEPRPDLGTPPEGRELLDRKISLLNDVIEVQNLQRSYGYFVDKNMWDEVTELFADDATLEIGGRGVYVGKKRVNQYMHFLAKQGPKHGWLFEHSQWQPVTDVAEDGKTAKQRLRAFVMAATPGGGEGTPASSVWGECTYENEYVKVNGAWKIAKLYAYFNMYSPYTDGWAKTALPNTAPEKNLPPDRAPTVVYDMYPAVGKVPYHYLNPVTGN